MTLKERWNAEETKIGKFFKFILGYSGVAAGIITDIAVNYMPAVSQYIPEGFAHALFKAGVICYGIGKLTAIKKPDA